MSQRFTVVEGEVAFGGPPLNSNYIKIYDSGKLVASVICRQKKGSIEINIRTVNLTKQVNSLHSDYVFNNLFGRTLAKELLARSYRWGKKRGLSKFYVHDTSSAGKALVRKAIEQGIIDKSGKILTALQQPIKFQTVQQDLNSLNSFRVGNGLSQINQTEYAALLSKHIPLVQRKYPKLLGSIKKTFSKLFRRR